MPSVSPVLASCTRAELPKRGQSVTCAFVTPCQIAGTTALAALPSTSWRCAGLMSLAIDWPANVISTTLSSTLSPGCNPSHVVRSRGRRLWVPASVTQIHRWARAIALQEADRQHGMGARPFGWPGGHGGWSSLALGRHSCCLGHTTQPRNYRVLTASRLATAGHGEIFFTERGKSPASPWRGSLSRRSAFRASGIPGSVRGDPRRRTDYSESFGQSHSKDTLGTISEMFAALNLAKPNRESLATHRTRCSQHTCPSMPRPLVPSQRHAGAADQTAVTEGQDQKWDHASYESGNLNQTQRTPLKLLQ